MDTKRGKTNREIQVIRTSTIIFSTLLFVLFLTFVVKDPTITGNVSAVNTTSYLAVNLILNAIGVIFVIYLTLFAFKPAEK